VSRYRVSLFRRTRSRGGSGAKHFETKAQMSEASQTVNDTKSTVVMEFSTVQKVVQVVDNDSEVNPPRIAFKEVILKDMTGKKNNHKTEQIFTSNDNNFMVTGKSS